MTPLVGALASRLSIYVVLVILARVMDPAEFGAYALVTVIISMVQPVIGGGGDMWLNRFSPSRAHRLPRAPRIWKAYLLLCLLLGAATGAVGLAGLAGPGLVQVTAVGLLTASVAGFGEAVLAILRASGFVRSFFILRDMLAPAVLLSTILLVQPSTAVTTLLIQAAVWLLILLAAGVIMLLHAGTMLPVVFYRRSQWQWMTRHTATLSIGNLMSRLAVNMDILVLSAILALPELGEFRVATQFAIGFTVVQHFLFLGLPWQLRHLGGFQAPGTGFAQAYSRQRILLGLSLTALLALWFGAPHLLGLLGERFQAVTEAFRFLLLLRFAELLWGPQHEVLVSNGHAEQDAAANLLSIVVWIPALMAVWLLQTPVIATALAANLASSVMRGVIRELFMRRQGLPPVLGHQLGWAPLGLVYVALLVELAWL